MSRSNSIDEGLIKHSDQDYTDPSKLHLNNKNQESSLRFHSTEI